VARYDVLMAACVVASCCCFVAAYRHNSRVAYAAAGGLAGLATISHPNGALILVVLVGVLLWQCGLRALRSAPLYLLVVGRLPIHLSRHTYRTDEQILADRFLILATPVLAILLAALINYKNYAYLVLILPFVAIQVAVCAMMSWRWAISCRGRMLPALMRLA